MMKTKKNKSVLNICVTITYKMAVIALGLLLPKMFITNYGSEINGLQASVKQLFTYIALLEAGVGASTLQMLYKPVSTEDYQVANSYLSAASYYYNKIGINIVFPTTSVFDHSSFPKEENGDRFASSVALPR